jgi:FixJ family two-component response regulator
MTITDFKLPGASGLEILRKLQKSQPRLLVILITAHGMRLP